MHCMTWRAMYARPYTLARQGSWRAVLDKARAALAPTGIGPGQTTVAGRPASASPTSLSLKAYQILAGGGVRLITRPTLNPSNAQSPPPPPPPRDFLRFTLKVSHFRRLVSSFSSSARLYEYSP